LGDSKNIRDSVARVLPAFQKGHRYYASVMGMYAYGLEEMGDYEKAERYAREALGTLPNQFNLY
jgi:hypothetical protein